MRLAKYLAHSGVASRRRAEEIIRAGRVRVNGELVTDPARDVAEEAPGDVRVDGKTVRPEETEVWLLNKPAGVVSTAKEPGARPAVVELVTSQVRLYPVGRLDAESTGLILLTNDGALANRLTHPRYEVAKTYRARLARPVSDTDIAALERGVRLEDGLTAPAEVRRISREEIEIVLREGRNRQVRRMAEAVGNRVTSLTRTQIGSLRLGRIAVGASRRLRQQEIEQLWEDAGGD